MSQDGAEKAVLISALIVFGIYFYRHLSEGTSTGATGTPCNVPKGVNGNVGKLEQFAGFGTPANIGQFVTAWGFVFFVLSVLAQAAPGLGGSMALLVLTADLLGNSCQLTHDISAKAGVKQSKNQVAGAGNITPLQTGLTPLQPLQHS